MHIFIETLILKRMPVIFIFIKFTYYFSNCRYFSIQNLDWNFSFKSNIRIETVLNLHV